MWKKLCVLFRRNIKLHNFIIIHCSWQTQMFELWNFCHCCFGFSVAFETWKVWKFSQEFYMVEFESFGGKLCRKLYLDCILRIRFIWNVECDLNGNRFVKGWLRTGNRFDAQKVEKNLSQPSFDEIFQIWGYKSMALWQKWELIKIFIWLCLDSSAVKIFSSPNPL